jgi:hypothetical protein
MALTRYPNFTGGSFTAQNPFAANERTMNFCPDLLKTAGATNTLVLDPTPGSIRRAASRASPHRGMYEHNERVYFVAGDRFCELLKDWTVIERGTVVLDAHPATLWANGEAAKQIFVTSGEVGYIFETATNAFRMVLPGGATMGQMLDGYFLALDARTSSFGTSKLLDGTVWDMAGGGGGSVTRSAAPDPWRSFAINDKIIALFGDKTTEFWYNAGGSPFPFDPIPNALIPYGIQAPFSPVSIGGSLFWLSRTAEAAPQVVMATGTNPQVVSTSAIHWALRRYPRTDDAVGYTESYLGHQCYGLTFPTARATWVFDLTTGLWHEEGTWIAEEDQFDALRPLYFCFAFGRRLAGDRESGRIYERSTLQPLDVDDRPLRRVRRPPFLFASGRMLSFGSFELVLQTGLAGHQVQLAETPSATLRLSPVKHGGVRLAETIDPRTDPQIELRRSNDGGETWWSAGFRSAGQMGEFTYRPTWNRLGATDQLAGFEVVMSSPIPWRVVDALVDVQPGIST